MVVFPPVPRPPFTTQALKPLVVTASTQIKTESCSPDGTFPWLTEVNTRIRVPLEKLLLNDTYSHWERPITNSWNSIFPLSTPSKGKTNKQIRCFCGVRTTFNVIQKCLSYRRPRRWMRWIRDIMLAVGDCVKISAVIRQCIGMLRKLL